MDIIFDEHTDYKCLEVTNGYKKELWSGVSIIRPETSSVKATQPNNDFFNDCDLYYEGDPGKGQWKSNKSIKRPWVFNYKDLNFHLEPNNFNQVGLFPEQAFNWDFVAQKIKESQRNDIKVLNLFAYTGAASINASLAGAKEVVHLDALRSVNEIAKKNSILSNVENNKIRYLQDDVLKFLKREIRRKNIYDIVIMDPPSFGRGPKGEIWKFDKHLDELFSLVAQVVANPLCIVISTYHADFDKKDLQTLMTKHFKGKVTTGKLSLPIVKSNSQLDCGVYGHLEL